MTQPSIWCLVPVKRLAEAKQRLAPVLSPLDRCRLAIAMMRDVLDAAIAAPGIAGVAVVTSDPAAADIAASSGALVLPDHAEGDLNASLTHARRILVNDRAAGGLVILPADIPLVEPADVATLAALLLHRPTVAIVTAAADGGSNALGLSPVEAIPLHYGTDSARRHAREATARGIAVVPVDLPRLALDIDRPGDIAALTRSPVRTRSRDVLLSAGSPAVGPAIEASCQRSVLP